MQDSGKAIAPASSQDGWERINQVAASSISGAAGGALLGSAFGNLTGAVVGALAGFLVNAFIAATSVG